MKMPIQSYCSVAHRLSRFKQLGFFMPAPTPRRGFLKNDYRLCLLSILLPLAGCGGDSNSATGSSLGDVAQVELEQSLVATVIIEERSGKTVLDAWFSTGARNQANDTFLNDMAVGDKCQLYNENSNAQVASTVRVNTEVSVVSRTETFATLEAFESGSVSSYTTDVRWLDTPIPDDAVLSFDEQDVLSSLSTIALPELEPLEWVSPTTGLLDSAEQSLQWVPSQADDTRIQLNFSSVSRSGTEASSIVIQCTVVDDGEFALDTTSRQALGGDEADVIFRALRQRTRIFSSSDESAAVIQISHASI